MRAVEYQYVYMRDGDRMDPPGDDITVEIHPGAEGAGSFDLLIDRKAESRLKGLGRLLREVDNLLCFRLQQEVPELYFVHAAVIARGDSATLFPGSTGSGKSTLAYILSNHGLRYLSDELAPIDLASNLVIPYPRAICLKTAPFPPMQPPRRWLRTECTFHVHADEIGAAVSAEPARIDRIVFPRSGPRGRRASLRRLTIAEAALRLYQNALNQLAHPSWGIDDALRAASNGECYELQAGEANATIAALEEAGVL